MRTWYSIVAEELCSGRMNEQHTLQHAWLDGIRSIHQWLSCAFPEIIICPINSTVQIVAITAICNGMLVIPRTSMRYISTHIRQALSVALYSHQYVRRTPTDTTNTLFWRMFLCYLTCTLTVSGAIASRHFSIHLIRNAHNHARILQPFIC